jgi:hypothetical protein
MFRGAGWDDLFVFVGGDSDVPELKLILVGFLTFQPKGDAHAAQKGPARVVS